MGASAVMAIKQEPQGLIMPAQAVVQNQQEVCVVVQGSMEASVYVGMTSDRDQLREYPLNRVLCPHMPLGQVQTLLRF